MALKIRRGSDAVRQTITPSEGELLYTTDTKKLYIGDGSALGGTRVSSGVETGTAFSLASYATDGEVVTPTDSLTWSDLTNVLKVDSGTLTVTTGGGSARSLLNINTHYSQSYAGSLVFNKSRGTETVPAQLINGDVVGSITWNSYIKDGYQAGTTINSNLAGAPGSAGTPFTINYTSKSGTSPCYVTFSIPSQTAPTVSKSYTIEGNSNTNYNGSKLVSASSATSITLIYTTDPGTFGTGTTTASLDPVLTTDLNIFTSTSNGNRQKTLRVFNNGQVYIGPIITDFTNTAYDASWTGQINITSTSSNSTQTTAGAQVGLRTYSNIVQSQSMNILRYRGTIVAPTALVDGDQVFNIKYLGYDGAALRNVAQIITSVDAPVSSGITPGAVTILTTSSTGALVQAVKIDHTQKTSFNGSIDVGGSITTSEIPGTFWNYDASDSVVDLEIGGVVNFSNFSGSVLVTAFGTGTVTHYLCGGGDNPNVVGSSKVSGPTGNMVSNVPINGYSFVATEAGEHSFYVIRTRNNA